ncbi:MAG TPA: EamA family transporter [Pirellulales bacterium]|nr:EamA family transporter [Pirellulales bacterium]
MSDPAAHSSHASRHVATGRACVLLAALLWSTSGLFVKAGLFSDWPEHQRGMLFAFWRAAFAGLLLLPAVRRPQWDWKLLALAFSFTTMSVCVLQSMTYTTAANAIWLENTAPLWVCLCGVLVWPDGFERRDLAPLVCGGLGVGIILYYELRGADLGAQQIGVLLGVVSGVVYAGVIVCLRQLRSLGGAWLVAVMHVAAAAALAPFCLASGTWPVGQQWLALLGFGLFQTGVPYLLYARGVRSITSQEAAGIGLLEPVMSPLLVYVFYGEKTACWTIVGGVLILFGLAARYAKVGGRPAPG